MFTLSRQYYWIIWKFNQRRLKCRWPDCEGHEGVGWIKVYLLSLELFLIKEESGKLDGEGKEGFGWIKVNLLSLDHEPF